MSKELEVVAWMSPGRERLEFCRHDTVFGSHTIPLVSQSDAMDRIRELEAENAELQERNAERDDALRYMGFEDSTSGIHEVIAAEAFEAPDEWYEKPFCRIQYFHDSGDPSVGIPGYRGWELSKDQSGTVIADLVDADIMFDKES